MSEAPSPSKKTKPGGAANAPPPYTPNLDSSEDSDSDLSDSLEDVLEGEPEEDEGDSSSESSQSSRDFGNEILTDPDPQRGPTRDYNESLSTAVSASVKLPTCEIGAVELLTFFPNHTQWPLAHLRITSNGWKSPDVAKYSLYARGTLSYETAKKRSAALRHQLSKNGIITFDETFTLKTHRDQLPSVATYDTTSYVPRPLKDEKTRDLTTAYLVDLAKGVTATRMPTGQDRGILTQVSKNLPNY